MSRSSLFWILMALWFILGWWLCKKFICGASDASTTTAAAAAPIIAAADDKCDTSLLIEDGTFKSSSDRNLRFPKSSFENIAYGKQTQDALQSTVDYLANNANRSLTITGRYAGDESYDGILPNLGMARATTVKNILTGMGASASQIDVQGSQNEDICYSQNSTGGGNVVGSSYAEIAGTGIPMASVLAAGGTGAASDTEAGTGEGTQLGAGSGSGSGSGGGNIIGNGVGYAFTAASTGDTRLAEIKERLYGKPITLYFDKNSDNLSLTQQQRQDFADLSYYLDKVSAASLSVEGHTDSDGEVNFNRRLSRSRAEFVQKDIVDRAGINTSRLSAQGFGETKPITSNDSVEGKAKNRRVEVILK